MKIFFYILPSALKNCTAAFGKCRKFEDDASTAITACSSDSSKLTAKVMFPFLSEFFRKMTRHFPRLPLLAPTARQ